MKKPLHEKKVYPNVREVIEDIGNLYGERTAFSYRIKASDKVIQKKSYIELRDDVRALATEFIRIEPNSLHWKEKSQQLDCQ